jgi:hypothetical protein
VLCNMPQSIGLYLSPYVFSPTPGLRVDIAQHDLSITEGKVHGGVVQWRSAVRAVTDPPSFALQHGPGLDGWEERRSFLPMVRE